MVCCRNTIIVHFLTLVVGSTTCDTAVLLSLRDLTVCPRDLTVLSTQDSTNHGWHIIIRALKLIGSGCVI